MQTYRELASVPEFRVLFLGRCVVMVSVAASALALGTITYSATGSTLLTALSMFGGPLVSLVVSQLWLAAADSFRPRTSLLLQVGAALVANTLQAVPGMPWQARLALLTIPYVVNGIVSGAVWVIVRDLVPAESFVLARSALNLAVGGMQIVGYGVGGVALLWLSATDLFVVAAAADAVCLVAFRWGLRDRPALGDRTGSLVQRTREVNRLLLGSPVTRPIYLAMWVPNGLVVGCEALYVPYGHGAVAGALFAAAAAGMMFGDLMVGRFVSPHLRDRLLTPLRVLLPAPYVAMLLGPPPGVAIAIALVASVGYAASLPLQERLIAHTDRAVQGQTMGLYSQGLMVGQAVGALVGGALGVYLTPSHSMGVLALASLAVTAANSPGLRRSAPAGEATVSASGSPSS